jgi:hypothetical protein
MWQEPPRILRAEEHDIEELDLDGREIHPQDLDDGEEDLEEEEDLLD